MSPLTRDEAQHRARFLHVHEYTVDLDLSGGEEVFGSSSTVRFTARTGGDSFVDVRPVKLHRAVLDGVELDAGDLVDGRLPLRGLAAGEHELRVEAEMPYSRVGEGMHRFTDPADGRTYLYSQCFLDDAPRVFACFDQPDLKAVFRVSVTAPADWTVLGNGVAERIGDGRWVCAPTPPISTYLVAVVAGPYHSVRSEHAGLPFGLHVRASLAEHLDRDAEELLDVTRRCFDRYHEIFDEPYPFDSYDQAFVPEFNAGAMENPGLVTLRDEKIFRSAATETEVQDRAVTVAHEMAHMWFGDLVTLRWWDDVWLNESFADYMGYQVLSEATRHGEAWTEFTSARTGWGSDADQRGSTHPVAPDAHAVPDTATALLNFDGISYAKGACALRQLVAWLGETTFLAGVNDHFSRHRFGNATLADFVDSLARASTDRDVHGWAAAWLRTTGLDTLSARVADDGAGGWLAEVEHLGSRPHRIAVGLYDRSPEDRNRLVLRERLDRDLAADGGGLSLKGQAPRPDLVLLNDGALTYAKVRLDEVSWEAARGALSGLPDGLSRAVAWNAAREMVRDGELPPEAYLEAVRAHVPLERDESVVQAVLAFARRQVADRFLSGRTRAGALEVLVGACRALLDRTDGGTEPGVRLTALRCLLESSTDTDELLAWRTGTVPGGPVLDAELRWLLLLRLSVLGAVGEDAIAEALAEDRSAAGEQGAARCRAALPDAGAKERAWEAMFGDADTLSNRIFVATAQGFWQPEQEDLLEPYASRFFDAAVQVSRRRGAAIAQGTARWAFPHAVAGCAGDEVLTLGEQCLQSGAPVPALARGLADQLDDLRRVLAVRGAG
ncbi:aminopeptidase N [Streptomyces sp. TR02-1]|uniref:aminopeptidase N n=1 Tax=Streptomyces sp. TR02-1 TaxID=3385977 RepID=UPI0039A3E41E